jgi:hypothetical protein
MKTISVWIAILFVLSPYIAFPSNTIYIDHFPNGKPELRWAFFPYFNLDNLEGAIDPTAPDGDNGVGILKNANVGGFASLSYAVTRQLRNFYVEARIYCPITEGSKGPLSGIAFLIDPFRGSFYRLICDFKTDAPILDLAYVGLDTRNYPVYLNIWNSKEIPNGVPKESDWHKIALRVREGVVTCYWDGMELKGGPFFVDQVQKGFVGVYTNYVGGFGAAITKIDSFLLKEE